MNFGSLHYFLGIKSVEKQFKIVAQWWAEIGPRLQCQLGGLPLAAGQKVLAGRAMAWRPGPVVEAARVLSTRQARCGMVTACSGALVGGPVAVSRWQGPGLEHHG
jgi:hypothetical protein